MSTQTFMLLLIVVSITGVFTFLLGLYLGYQRGFDDGYEAGEEFTGLTPEDDEADDLAGIRWQLLAPLEENAETLKC